MSVESEIYSRLSGYADLTALVGAKIYPLTIPPAIALPALSYFKVSDIPTHAMGSDGDIKTVRVQVSCWAATYNAVKSIEVQVRAALSRYRGGNIKDCFFDGSIDLYESETLAFHVPVDFIVFFAG